MNSLSGFKIGNDNKSRENRKNIGLSFSSSIHMKKPDMKVNTVLIKSLNIERQEQDLNEFIQSTSSFFTNSISNSSSKFEITPETVNHLNQHQTDIQRRPRIQWRKRPSLLHLKNKHASIILTSSSTKTTVTKLKEENLNSHSITEMTSKNSDNEYQRYTDQDDLDPILKSTSMNTMVDDNEKDFANQGSQTNLINGKVKKRMKSPNHHRKIKSATKQQPTQTDLASTTLPKFALSTKTIEDNNVGKNLITVDTSKARSNLDVIRMCIRELGWKECSFSTTPDSDIYWHSSSFHEGDINFSINSGRVNKFPGMNDLLRKVHLTRSLNNMRLLFPTEFNFYPKTWFLPEQSQQFKDDIRYIHQQDKQHNHSLTTFIVKPSDGSQGEGIYLIRDPAHCLVTNRPHVVQEYIDRPLLINGLKFDLRIYVLILNLYPLEIFLYDEGLVRFATVDYKPPSTENLHQIYMHLTNYSLNKRSSNYKHTFDHTQIDGSKRKLSTVWTQLISIFGNEKIERTKTLINEMVNKTILAILPELRVEYESELSLGKKQNISCFQIVGFDIILTDDFRPVLLEVNANPSLRIDFEKENETGKLIYQSSPLDEEIKKPLILETLQLALPKKKLHTFARHAQLQINDELTTKHYEKIAQRRIDERSERIRSAQKVHFDLKINPFFSRPPPRITKEPEHLQELPEARTTTAPTDPLESTTINNKPERIIVTKSKKLSTKEDDNESGTPTVLVSDTNHTNSYPTSSTSIKRPIIKSITNHYRTPTMTGSIKKLKPIFPAEYKAKYRHLLLLDKIAYIYIQLVVMLGHKTMTGVQFRHFTNICGIINGTITASSIDILYYQILRKWQQFVLRTPSTGLPFSAFIEAFFLLSQRKFPDTHSLLDSVDQLVNICVHNLNSSLQTSLSPNQYFPHRTTRMNNSRNRARTAPSSVPPILPTTNTDNKIKQSTKSVFPLFFDVL